MGLNSYLEITKWHVACSCEESKFPSNMNLSDFDQTVISNTCFFINIGPNELERQKLAYVVENKGEFKPKKILKLQQPKFWGETPKIGVDIIGLFCPTNLSKLLQKEMFVTQFNENLLIIWICRWCIYNSLWDACKNVHIKFWKNAHNIKYHCIMVMLLPS